MRLWGGALLAAFAAVLVLQIVLRPALPIDETRYLAVAWEMHLSGDIFHLTRNFESYSHKPPLLFWLINLVWLGTGVSEIAARLVGPAFAVVSVLLTGQLARRFWPQDETIALRSMAILVGFTLFSLYGGALMFDALLTVFVLLGLLVLWRIGQGARGWRPWLWLGLVLAFGTLAKGPVILLHLVPALLAIRLWASDPPDWREIGRGGGVALLVALALVLVWLVPALLGGDAAFRKELLVTQSVSRVSGELGHGRPIWFLIALLPVILFPWGWSWRLWQAVPAAVKGDGAGRLVAIWAVSALVLFSIVGGKQVHYLLPELPAMALLFARASTGQDRRGGSLAFVLPVLLAIVLGLAAAGLIRDRNLADLTPVWAVVLVALLCLGLAVASLRLPLLRGDLALGLGLALTLHLLAALTLAGRSQDTVAIGQALAARQSAGIAFFGMPYNAEFNFAGRLTAPVEVPMDHQALTDWAKAHPDGLVVGPTERSGIAVAPDTTWRFRSREFGGWSGATLTAGP